MGHDVMHFSCNVAAFIRGRQIPFLLPLDFEPAGLILESLHRDAAGPGQVTEGPGDIDKGPSPTKLMRPPSTVNPWTSKFHGHQQGTEETRSKAGK